MKRVAVFGLVLLAVLPICASASFAKQTAKRPLLFAVGTTTLHFDNEGRTLDATVYYPAKGRATTLDIENAPRATQWGPYPLILFSHDFNVTARAYQALLHSWAEHGYVVAVPKYVAPTSDTADANGQVVIDLGERVADASFIIDRMSDRVRGFATIVDGDHVAAAGHALGAVVTYVLAFSADGRDPRINAAVALSGGIAGDPSNYFTGVDTPLLAIHGDADVTDPIDGTSAIYALASPPKFFVTLLGADHNSAFEKSGTAAFQVVDETTRDFFSAYLNGRPSGLQQLLRDGKVAEVAKIKSAPR
jgi:predicted dienelactone hydrolase